MDLDKKDAKEFDEFQRAFCRDYISLKFPNDRTEENLKDLKRDFGTFRDGLRQSMPNAEKTLMMRRKEEMKTVRFPQNAGKLLASCEIARKNLINITDMLD